MLKKMNRFSSNSNNSKNSQIIKKEDTNEQGTQIIQNIFFFISYE